MNVLLAIQAGNALIALAQQALAASAQYNELVGKAQSEGRDISDEELAALKAESDRVTEEVIAKLRGGNG